MMETYSLGVYWGPRQEDAEACARRTSHMVQLLERIDPLFARWFKCAKSRKETLKRPLDSDLVGLSKYVQRVVMKDDCRVPMPDGGFHLWLWNGESRGDDVWLDILCGSYSEWLSNHCILKPPYKGPVAERVLTTDFQTQVLRAMATAWDPDWGVAMSDTHRELLKDTQTKVPTGWATYLSHRRGHLPPLPTPVRLEPVGELGTLVILTPERFTASNSEHLELAGRVREKLDRAGLLHHPWARGATTQG